MMLNYMCANVITTTVAIGTFMHLAVLNFFIGIIEGLCLGIIFKLPKWKTMGWMVLANYFSSWLGMFLLKGVRTEDIAPYQVETYIIEIVAVAYLLTLILEFPFVYLACKSKSPCWKYSIIGSLMVQTVSYVLLIGFWYYPISSIGILKDVQWVKKLDFVKNNNAVMYYIDATGKNVYRTKLNGGDQTLVFTSEKGGIDVLGFEYDEEKRTADLVAFSDKHCLVIKSALNEAEYETRKNRFRWGDEAEDFRNEDERVWLVSRSEDSLWLVDSVHNNETRLRLDVPFLKWPFCWLSVLPGDEIVFQLGNQICIYSRPENKLALLVKGTSPAVFLEDPAENQTVKTQSSNSAKAPEG